MTFFDCNYVDVVLLVFGCELHSGSVKQCCALSETGVSFAVEALMRSLNTGYVKPSVLKEAC